MDSSGKETQMALELEHHLFALSQFIEVNRGGSQWITYGRLVWVRPRDNSATSIQVPMAWAQSHVPNLITEGLENVVWLCTQEEDETWLPKHKQYSATVRSSL